MPKTSTSFKKGEVHNPKGRPKREWTWSGVLQEAVEATQENGIPVKQMVAKSLIKGALSGDIHAIKELMNRMDGMPQQDIKHDGEITVEGVIIYKPEKNTE